MEILSFDVEGRGCGVPVSCVLELVRAVAIRPLPCGVTGLEGAINLRGRAIAVFDLRVRLGLPLRPVDPADHLVIARAGDQVVALRVDRATGLVALETEAIADAPAIAPGARGLRGVVSHDADLLFIYDLERFLSESEATAVERAIADVQAAGEI